MSTEGRKHDTQGLILDLRSLHSAPFVELQQSFPSQIQVISPFVDQLMRFILNFRFADGSEVDIETALREALANAVIHGNGKNPNKHVQVECRCFTDGVSITVRDEVPGFDSNAVPDPTTPETRLSGHGRGIYLMKTLMDEVSFEENSTIVHMRKRPRLAPPHRRQQNEVDLSSLGSGT